MKTLPTNSAAANTYYTSKQRRIKGFPFISFYWRAVHCSQAPQSLRKACDSLWCCSLFGFIDVLHSRRRLLIGWLTGGQTERWVGGQMGFGALAPPPIHLLSSEGKEVKDNTKQWANDGSNKEVQERKRRQYKKKIKGKK